MTVRNHALQASWVMRAELNRGDDSQLREMLELLGRVIELAEASERLFDSQGQR